jgi:predicted transcriptional regulator
VRLRLPYLWLDDQVFRELERIAARHNREVLVEAAEAVRLYVERELRKEQRRLVPKEHAA